jgi:predicted glycoside hydrolase/deacetylase ChbG (UPF0249 family)
VRQIILCADDYALNPQVTRGILLLAQQQRLSATSAMVEAPSWKQAARELPRNCSFGVGLHLNLTQAFSGQADAGLIGTLPAWILRAYSRSVPRQRLRQAIERQLDLFEEAMGKAPDYIDGHQHVHQFPVVRDALLDALCARYAESQRPWIRRTRPPSGQPAPFKDRVIAWLGDAALGSQMCRRGFSGNPALIGVYGFDGDEQAYRERLQGWVTQAPAGSVLMCHPAQGAPDPSDPIGDARQREFAVLASDWFGQMLAQSDVSLTADPRVN